MGRGRDSDPDEAEIDASIERFNRRHKRIWKTVTAAICLFLLGSVRPLQPCVAATAPATSTWPSSGR